MGYSLLIVNGGAGSNRISLYTMNDKAGYYSKVSHHLTHNVIYAENNASVILNGGEYSGCETKCKRIEVLHGEEGSNIRINSGCFYGSISLGTNFYIKSLDMQYDGDTKDVYKMGRIRCKDGINIWSTDYIDADAEIYEDGVLVNRNPTSGLKHGGDSNDRENIIYSNHIEIKNVIPIDNVELSCDCESWIQVKISDKCMPSFSENSLYFDIEKIEYFDENLKKDVGLYGLTTGHNISARVTLKALGDYSFKSIDFINVTIKNGEKRQLIPTTVSDDGKSIVLRYDWLITEYKVNKITDKTIYTEWRNDGKYYLNQGFKVEDICHPYDRLSYKFYYKDETGIHYSQYTPGSSVYIERKGEYECWYEVTFPTDYHPEYHKKLESDHFKVFIVNPFLYVNTTQTINAHINSNIKLSANVSGNSLSFVWKDSEGKVIDYEDHPYYIVTNHDKAGTYNYSCKVTDITGKNVTFSYEVIVDDVAVWDKEQYYPYVPHCYLIGHELINQDPDEYEITLIKGDEITFEMLYSLEKNNLSESKGRKPAVDKLDIIWTYRDKTYTKISSIKDTTSYKFMANTAGEFLLECSVKNTLPTENSSNNYFNFDYFTINITVLNEAPSYNISRDELIKNGSIEISQESAKEGTSITITPHPSNGYTIESLWVTENSTGKEISVSTDNKFIMPAGDVTVHANFTVDFCKISFAGGEGAIGTEPDAVNAKQNGTVILPKNTFIKKGYKFVGWTDGSKTYEADSEFNVPFKKTITLTAKWEALTVFKITFAGGTGATGTAPTALSGYENDKVTLPNNTFTKKGYTFVGWTDGSETYKAGSSYTIPAKNVKLSAKWEALTVYKITFAGGTGAKGTAPTALSGYENDKVKLPKNTFTKTGYEFVGWTDGNAVYKAGSSYTISAKNVKLTAKWKKKEVTKRELIEQFVERMYTKALGRSAEPDGLKYWADRLEQKIDDGANCAYGFITSDEFINKKLSDDQFVETMYQTFFGRASDATGKSYWLNQIKTGMSREMVLAGFVKSDEFDTLCTKAGIERGLILEDGKPVNSGIYLFVKRQYTCCLQREGEKDGIEYWAKKIAKHEVSAVDTAKEFFFSKEFEDKGLSDKQFVERLYETFLGRPFDEVGYAYWNDKMSKGETRRGVLDEFASSKEFQDILKSFGL